MSTRPSIALDPTRSVVDQLRERVAAMERRPAREPIATLPALAEVAPLTAGSTYGVDSATLALALAAGASQAGEWVGFAGWSDFGVEAAAGLGIELSRTVLVPDLGEHWLEVTAALVDVLRVVVIRPPASVDARAAEVLESRLRTRSGVLVVWGPWPRCEARLSLEDTRWSGPQDGAGWLGERSVSVVARRGERVVRRAELTFATGVELVAPSPTPLRRAAT